MQKIPAKMGMLAIFLASSLILILLVIFARFNLIGVTLVIIVTILHQVSFDYYRDKAFHHLSIGEFLRAEYTSPNSYNLMLAYLCFYLVLFYRYHITR